MRDRLWFAIAVVGGLAACTEKHEGSGPTTGTNAPVSEGPIPTTNAPAPFPSTSTPTSNATATPPPPRLYSKTRILRIHSEPTPKARWIGYVGLGGSVPLQSPDPIPASGSVTCYAVLPKGYACAEKDTATLDPEDPIYQALLAHTPKLDSAWPFHYGESKGARRHRTLPGFEERAWPRGVQDFRDEIAARSTVAWTEEVEALGTSWLWTSDLSFVRKDRVTPHPRSEFRGVHLGSDVTLPIAFFRRAPRTKYRLDANGRFVDTGEVWERLEWVGLTGRTERVGRQTFRETTAPDTNGGDASRLWVNDRDATVVAPMVPRTPWKTAIRSSAEPASSGPRRTWIEVAALSGWLIAYEDDRPVFATLISAGKLGAVKPTPGAPQPPATTPLGSYPIRTKYRTTTLVSDLDDGTDFVHAEVPWSQHFYDKYLLHTAYWHDAWGEGRSGGCVNLSPADARWLFDWTEPQVPEGWHAYRTAEDDRATMVVLHP